MSSPHSSSINKKPNDNTVDIDTSGLKFQDSDDSDSNSDSDNNNNSKKHSPSSRTIDTSIASSPSINNSVERFGSDRGSDITDDDLESPHPFQMPTKFKSHSITSPQATSFSIRGPVNVGVGAHVTFPNLNSHPITLTTDTSINNNQFQATIPNQNQNIYSKSTQSPIVQEPTIIQGHDYIDDSRSLDINKTDEPNIIQGSTYNDGSKDDTGIIWTDPPAHNYISHPVTQIFPTSDPLVNANSVQESFPSSFNGANYNINIPRNDTTINNYKPTNYVSTPQKNHSKQSNFITNQLRYNNQQQQYVRSNLNGVGTYVPPDLLFEDDSDNEADLDYRSFMRNENTGLLDQNQGVSFNNAAEFISSAITKGITQFTSNLPNFVPENPVPTGAYSNPEVYRRPYINGSSSNYNNNGKTSYINGNSLGNIYESGDEQALDENEINIDSFLLRIYEYYLGKGLYAIILNAVCNLGIVVFMVFFSTFIGFCIDYSKFSNPDMKFIGEAVDFQKCSTDMQLIPKTLFILFCIAAIGKLFLIIKGVPKLLYIHKFYVEKLGVSEKRLQTLDWNDILERLRSIPRRLPGSVKVEELDAYVISNRIMRKENYMIALINKKVLDLKVPFLGNRSIITKSVELTLDYVFFKYIFDSKNQIRPEFLEADKRNVLISELRERIRRSFWLSLVLSPFIAIGLLIYFIFRYSEELHKNPSSLTARRYSPYAKWKFREFNELPHLFARRLNRSYENAVFYLNQFPNHKLAIICRFIAFVTGAFTTALVLLTMFEERLLNGVEVTRGLTVVFYIGLFGTIMAISRGAIPEEGDTNEPTIFLQEVVKETHYLPKEWEGHMHTQEVRDRFAEFFNLRILLFLQEVLSVFLIPYFLYFKWPDCSEDTIDFFRKFTEKSEHLGLVCSFATFDFSKHGNINYGVLPSPATIQPPASTTDANKPIIITGSNEPTPISSNFPNRRLNGARQLPKHVDSRLISNEGKMEQSFLNFKANNPNWVPNSDEGNKYLNAVVTFWNTNNKTPTYTTTGEHYAGGPSDSTSPIIMMGSQHLSPNELNAETAARELNGFNRRSSPKINTGQVNRNTNIVSPGIPNIVGNDGAVMLGELSGSKYLSKNQGFANRNNMFGSVYDDNI